MDKILNKVKNILIPKGNTNLIILFTIGLGLIMGIIYYLLISNVDKNEVTAQIKNIFTTIKTNNFNHSLSFKNAIIFNIVYIISIYILGLSIIGIPIILFLVFLKGFMLTFTITSIISTYNFNGLFGSFAYIFPTSIINILLIMLISIYSINFSITLINIIIKKKNNDIKYIFYRYCIVFGGVAVLSILTAVLDAYVQPFFIKLFSQLFL